MLEEELKENDVAYIDVNGYKYNIKDAEILNRLKSYIDNNLAKQLKKEFTGEIEENIRKIKNFIGFESDDLTGEPELLSLEEKEYNDLFKYDKFSKGLYLYYNSLFDNR